MRAFDRSILIALPLLALVIAFWFLVLSPKREEASKLGDEVASLESEVSELQRAAEFAEQAKDEFPRDYADLVTLGKAVPEDSDTPSLFAQLSGISQRASVDFRSLELVSGDGESAAPAPTPTEETTPAPAPTAETAPAAAPTGETAPPAGEAPAAESAAPTEAAAAPLPLGAAVGPAGLPVMPYKLEFLGDFFRVADFIDGLDGTVSTKGGSVSVDGRLMTIDGFSLTRDPAKGYPSLLANFAVTTYLTPSTEGLTAGASPSGPAPVSTETTSAPATETPSTAPAAGAETAP
jgi:hypothetical protein